MLDATPLTVDPDELPADCAALLTESPWVSPDAPLAAAVVDVCTVLRPSDAIALTHWPCAPGGDVGHVCAALETLSPCVSLLPPLAPLFVVDELVVVCATVATQSPCASAGDVEHELAALDTAVPWTAPAA